MVEGNGPDGGHPALSGGPSGLEQPKGTEGGSQKIKFGSHEFDSVEEVVRAYEKLESAYGEQSRKLGELRSVEPAAVRPGTTRRTLDFKKLGDKIIENPEEGVKEIAEYVEGIVEERVSSVAERSREAVSKERAEERIWDAFFDRNPWLAHRRDEVQLVAYNVLWPTLKGKSQEEQFSVMAEHFREATERSSSVLSGKELPARKPVSVSTATPSGIPGGKPPEPPPKSKSFVESVKEKSYVQKPGF